MNLMSMTVEVVCCPQLSIRLHNRTRTSRTQPLQLLRLLSHQKRHCSLESLKQSTVDRQIISFIS